MTAFHGGTQAELNRRQAAIDLLGARVKELEVSNGQLRAFIRLLVGAIRDTQVTHERAVALANREGPT